MEKIFFYLSIFHDLHYMHVNLYDLNTVEGRRFTREIVKVMVLHLFLYSLWILLALSVYRKRSENVCPRKKNPTLLSKSVTYAVAVADHLPLPRSELYRYRRSRMIYYVPESRPIIGICSNNVTNVHDSDIVLASTYFICEINRLVAGGWTPENAPDWCVHERLRCTRYRLTIARTRNNHNDNGWYRPRRRRILRGPQPQAGLYVCPRVFLLTQLQFFYCQTAFTVNPKLFYSNAPISWKTNLSTKQ